MPFALRILIIYPLLAILGLAAVAVAIVAIIIALTALLASEWLGRAVARRISGS